MQEQEQQIRDQIRDLMRAKKYDELDTLWLEVIDGEEYSLSFHEAVIRYLINRKEMERLREMYGDFAEQAIEKERFDHCLNILIVVLQHDPAYTALRRHMMAALRGNNPERNEERMDEFFRISGLDGDTPDLIGALRKVEDLLGAAKGQVFKHSQWGLGIVKELDATEGWAILDFDKKKNHRMTLVGLKDFLQRIPNDHVYARIAKTPEEFKQEVIEDPCSCIRLCLKNHKGKMKAPELKKILTTNFMTDAEFKKWWTKAKDEVRLDPYIDLAGKGASTLLTLRDKPRSFVDEISVRMVEATDLKPRREILRDVSKHGSAADMAGEDTKSLELLFLKPFEDGAITTDTEKFGNGLLFEEFSDLFTDDAKNPVDLQEFINRDRDEVIKLIGNVGIFDLQKIALDHVLKEREGDAAAIFSEVFFDAEPRLVTWMEKKLETMGSTETMELCVERVLSEPARNPDVFVWAAKKVFAGNLTHILESHSMLQILATALMGASELESSAITLEGKEEEHVLSKAQKLRLLVQEGTLKNVKLAIRDTKQEDARKFLATVNMNGSISNQLRLGIEQIVYTEHPELSRSKPSEEAEEAKDQHHYSTEAAIEAKRKDLSHILNTEIPENSVAIGVAREHGDLKENAEYHAAKDRQKVLMQTAKELEDLIARARPVDLSTVKTDQVRFGTRVKLLNKDTNENEEITLMGMWEANAEKKIVSYLTPFGSQVMGREPNEEFELTLPDGRKINYLVQEIHNVSA